MAMPDHIAAQLTDLDPAARAVVGLVWHMHEEQMTELQALRAQLRDRDAKLEAQQTQLDTYRRMLFGTRSEKLPPISSEVRRAIDEEELTPAALDLPSTASAEDIEEARGKYRRKRARKDSEPARERRRKALASLPVVRERIGVADDQIPPGMTRADFASVGEGTIVRRIEHVREHLVMTEYVLETLSERGGDAIVQARPPAGVIERGAWGPSVYAKVVVSKCVDSMPLYRQERALGRAGHAIARSVLCDLFHRAASTLAPLYDRLLDLACQHPYVHADETKIRVGEPQQARNAWVWTFLCEHIVAYVFSETRSGDNADRWLGGTSGVLIVDGYAGYNGVVGDEGRTRAGCWAHTRRKFFDALALAPQARELLAMIVSLYRIERDAADRGVLGTEVHALLRKEESTKVVEAIEAWIDAHKGTVTPKSPLGEAVTFASNQRKALRVFLTDPKIPLDNNIAERALRVVAVGRKNYLFVGHAEGGHNLAVLQTLCHTCLLHQINPYEYLQDVLIRVKTQSEPDLDALLPMNWSARPSLPP
jgi:transposase